MFRNYNKSEFLDIIRDNADYTEIKKKVEESGDGLLRFLFTELSTQEDCHTYDDFLQRINIGIKDLKEVANLYKNEK